MEEKPKSSKSNQFLVLILAAVVILIFSDLNRRMADARQLEKDYETLQTEIAQLESQNEELQTQVTALASDAMVREWAHSEERMVLPGEHLIIPLPGEESSTEPGYTTDPLPELPKPWDIWRALLFGK